MTQEELARKDVARPGSDSGRNMDATQLHQNLCWSVAALDEGRDEAARLQHEEPLTAHQLIQRALRTIDELERLGATKNDEARVARAYFVTIRARLLRQFYRR